MQLMCQDLMSKIYVHGIAYGGKSLEKKNIQGSSDFFFNVANIVIIRIQ